MVWRYVAWSGVPACVQQLAAQKAHKACAIFMLALFGLGASCVEPSVALLCAPLCSPLRNGVDSMCSTLALSQTVCNRIGSAAKARCTP
jgi:hypothetical protein